MTIHDLYNPLVRWLLRSPLHSLMSRRTLLMNYTGRKSGRKLTTPADYARQDQVVTLVSQKAHTWWRNLQGGARVTLTMAGRDLSGSAEVTRPDLDGAGRALRLLYPTMPATMVGRLAPTIVIVRIQLGEHCREGEARSEAVRA